MMVYSYQEDQEAMHVTSHYGTGSSVHSPNMKKKNSTQALHCRSRQRLSKNTTKARGQAQRLLENKRRSFHVVDATYCFQKGNDKQPGPPPV